MKNDNRPQVKSADIFLVLAEEAENMMKTTSESASKEAAEETEKFLQEYEQKARQIIVRTREKARMQASDIAERFKEALMQRIEEASASAMSQIMAGVGSKTEGMMQRLQQVVQTETRQALADALNGKPESLVARAENIVTKPASKPAAQTTVADASRKGADGISPESFESWLSQ
jgi:hypothetical protein